MELIIGLLSGAAGGNIAGKLLNSNMGIMGRSLTGIIGGGGLAYLIQMMGGGDVAPAASGMANIMSIAKSVVGGGVGGGLLTIILGKVMGNKG